MPDSPSFPHAVAQLRAQRLARSTRPFLARGGPKGVRCEGCRLRPSHCLCALRPQLPSHAAVCLLMHDAEPLKPSNTGWLIADVVRDTFAFEWHRTEWPAALLALLQDPQWQPYVVFPGEYADADRTVLHTFATASTSPASPTSPTRRPLLILLDATWSEARKMFRKSPYLDGFPVLSLQPEHIGRYRLRRAKREDHFCTSEVAALCLQLSTDAQDLRAGQVLEQYLEVYTHHYLQAKSQRPADWQGTEHQQLRAALDGMPAAAAQASGG